MATLGTALPPRLPASIGAVVKATPSTNISSLLSSVAPGSIIELAGGAYTERISCSRAFPVTVTIRPAPAAKVVLLNGIDFEAASGIRVMGASATDPTGYLLISGADSSVDLNFRIFKCAKIEVSFVELAFCSQPFYIHDSDDVHILGNWIHDAGADGNKEHGLYWGYGTNDRLVVASNLIERTRARGLQFYSGSWSNGFVVNNTVVDAGRGSMGKTDGVPTEGHAYQVNPGTGWKNMVVANNVALSPTHTGFDSRNGVPSGGQFVNNIAFGAGQSNDSWDGVKTDFREIDPKLDTKNSRPLPGSPCLNAAIAAYTPVYECLGALRATADIGALRPAEASPSPEPDPQPEPEPEPTDPCKAYKDKLDKIRYEAFRTNAKCDTRMKLIKSILGPS